MTRLAALCTIVTVLQLKYQCLDQSWMRKQFSSRTYCKLSKRTHHYQDYHLRASAQTKPTIYLILSIYLSELRELGCRSPQQIPNYEQSICRRSLSSSMLFAWLCSRLGQC